MRARVAGYLLLTVLILHPWKAGSDGLPPPAPPAGASSSPLRIATVSSSTPTATMRRRTQREWEEITPGIERKIRANSGEPAGQRSGSDRGELLHRGAAGDSAAQGTPRGLPAGPGGGTPPRAPAAAARPAQHQHHRQIPSDHAARPAAAGSCAAPVHKAGAARAPTAPAPSSTAPTPAAGAGAGADAGAGAVTAAGDTVRLFGAEWEWGELGASSWDPWAHEEKVEEELSGGAGGAAGGAGGGAAHPAPDPDPAFSAERWLREWAVPPPARAAIAGAGIRALFPWQLACVRDSGVLSGRSLVLSAPTNGGKTLVGDIALLRALLPAGGGGEAKRAALVVLPQISLVREKVEWLKRLCAGTGVRVSALFGNHKGGLSTRPGPEIVVCTIEKALPPPPPPLPTVAPTHVPTVHSLC